LVLLALWSVVGVVIGLWIVAAVLGLFARVIAKGVTVGIAQGRRQQNVWTAADRAFLAPPAPKVPAPKPSSASTHWLGLPVDEDGYIVRQGDKP
jgi:hypothetical protein